MMNTKTAQAGGATMTTGSMRKIVINKSYGKFCLSHAAFRYLRELGQREALQEEDRAAHWPAGSRPDEPSLNQFGVLIPRDDRHLVQAIETLGLSANGHAAELKVVEIPQDVQWRIEKTDGVEHISETHRMWG
jgi:hypothetical protein